MARCWLSGRLRIEAWLNSNTGLAAYNLADEKELQTTDLLHEGWMPGEPSRCQDQLSEFQRTSENKETTVTATGVRVR